MSRISSNIGFVQCSLSMHYCTFSLKGIMLSLKGIMLSLKGIMLDPLSNHLHAIQAFGLMFLLSFVTACLEWNCQISWNLLIKCHTNMNHLIKSIPGRIAQSVTCLVTDANLTADPGIVSSIPAWSHTLVEIGHEIISTVILLPSAESFMKGCWQLHAKVCSRITG